MGLAPSRIEQTPKETVVARCPSQFFNTLLARQASRFPILMFIQPEGNRFVERTVPAASVPTRLSGFSPVGRAKRRSAWPRLPLDLPGLQAGTSHVGRCIGGAVVVGRAEPFLPSILARRR